jgi:hypothetical protein
MSSSRRAIPVTCTTHRSGTNFWNLLMTKENDGTIVFDPHVDQCCVLRLDERAATAVFDTLGGVAGMAGRRRCQHAVRPLWLEFQRRYVTLRSWHATFGRSLSLSASGS